MVQIHVTWLMALLFVLGGCASAPGPMPGAGGAGSRLAPCPASPNCVVSTSKESGRGIAPLAFGSDGPGTWVRLVALLEADPEFTIVEATDTYLHAEARTRVLRFVDDVEFLLEEEAIAVRSASRVGFHDLGVNRRRIERVRRELAEQSPRPAPQGSEDVLR
jgi:uncharacterized protein (DUF1499 family)